MSWDVDVVDPISGKVKVLPAKHGLRGGMYVLGGDDQASLNVTYNYSELLHRVLGDGGLMEIDGLDVVESIPRLVAAAHKLEAVPGPEDYWAPTQWNVRCALLDLVTLAALAGSVGGGRWRVT